MSKNEQNRERAEEMRVAIVTEQGCMPSVSYLKTALDEAEKRGMMRAAEIVRSILFSQNDDNMKLMHLTAQAIEEAAK